MEVSENDDDLPEKYYCEQCRPQDHKALLAKVARNEKPWEERAKQRELEEQARRRGKKKGKRGGRRGRPSQVQVEEVKENGAMDTEPDTTQIEEPQLDAQPAAEVENNKRKLTEEPQAETESPSRGVSSSR